MLEFDFGYHSGLETYKPLLAELFGKLENGLNRFKPTEQMKLQIYSGLFDTLFAGSKPSVQFDYFFHDPFSPEVNPELWSPETFTSLKEIGSPDSVLSTYCAATSARASMAVAGWYVARADGALGKREMTLASLDPSRLSKWKRVDEKRLVHRFRNGDF